VEDKKESQKLKCKSFGYAPLDKFGTGRTGLWNPPSADANFNWGDFEPNAQVYKYVIFEIIF